MPHSPRSLSYSSKNDFSGLRPKPLLGSKKNLKVTFTLGFLNDF